MKHKPQRLLILLVAISIGGSVGGIIADLPGGIVGAGATAVSGGAIGFAGIRPSVALPIVLGTITGVVLGRSIVNVLCAPATCTTLGWIVGVATGIGAFVGIGLVVALVTRSFEEYNEAATTDNPPLDTDAKTAESDKDT